MNSPILLTILCVTILHGVDVEVAIGDMIKELSTGSLLQGRQIVVNDVITYAYLGVPYAEAPVGNKRYSAPESKKKWDGILDASKYKVSCLYNSSESDATSTNKYMSEDCLHLNVFASAKCLSNRQCPVLVIIHGGDFNYGSALWTEPEKLADDWASRDITTVTFDYRLGSFGFANFGENSSAVHNVGLLDQIKALKWVQREISHFGGNPNMVTLLGEGSAAINVDQLSLSPQADSLFQHAIILGGAANTLMKINQQTDARVTDLLALRAGCYIQNDDDERVEQQIVDCLRNESASKLLSIQRELEDSSILDSFRAPCIDSTEAFPIFPDLVSTLMQTRKAKSILIGARVGEISWMKRFLDGSKKSRQNRPMIDSLCRMAIKFRNLNTTEELVDACKEEYGKDSKNRNLIDDIAVYLPILETAVSNTVNDGLTYVFEWNDNNAAKGRDSQNSGSILDESRELKRAAMLLIKTGKASENARQWSEFSTSSFNYLALSSKNLVASGGYHERAMIFWTKIAPALSSNIPKSPNTSYQNISSQLDEALGTIEQIIDEAKNDTSIWQNVTQIVKEKWQAKMDELVGKLQTAVSEYKNLKEKEEAEEEMEKTTKHRRSHSTTFRPRRRATPRETVTEETEGLNYGDTEATTIYSSDKIKTDAYRRRTHGRKRFPFTAWQPRITTPREYDRQDKHRTTRRWDIPEAVSSAAPWLPVKNFDDIDELIEIEKEVQDGSTVIRVKIPKEALDKFDEVSRLVSDIFGGLQSLSSGEMESESMPNHNTDMIMSHSSCTDDDSCLYSVEPSVVRAFAETVLPIIVDPGNETVPTVPVITVRDTEGWDTWFWVAAIIVVVLAIVLVITCILFVQNRSKRLQYERIA